MVGLLQKLHRSGYIHNDLKPDNVVVGNKDPGRLYLIDFGSATRFRNEDGSHIEAG